MFDPEDEEEYEDTSLEEILAMEEAYNPVDYQFEHYERFGRPAFPNEY